MTKKNIGCLEKLNYNQLKFPSMKFEYATEYMTFTISKVKIKGYTYYVEPWNVSPWDEIPAYAIFEDYRKNSQLYKTLITRFKKGIMQENDRNLFYDKKYINIELWNGIDRKIFFVKNYYDTTINRTINIAIIVPFQGKYEF
jgi:hypothetical protein